MRRSYRGQPIDIFDQKVLLTSKNGVKSFKKPKKLTNDIEVTKGQTEVKGQSIAKRLTDHSGAIPDPVWHFYLKLGINHILDRRRQACSVQKPLLTTQLIATV